MSMTVWKRAFRRKSVERLQHDAANSGLRKALGPWNLLLLGIGCILGAGIYVMPGIAAAHYAGPAVLVSFMIAGAACAFTALCYAELAATMPVSGSAYTYAYASVGEVFAWSLGWLMLLEYGFAAASLAVGFSGYLASLLRDFGIVIPSVLSTAMFTAQAGGGLIMTHGANLVAALAILVVTLVLTRGVTHSALVNNILVAVKLVVLMGFIVVGVGAINPHNWTPFVPPSEGGFTYGWAGVMRGSSILFFAYIGFETVSTAASETRNPQRDLPIGILGSLAVCTVLYIIVAAILTGVVPYRELAVPDPIAVAVDRMGHPALATLVKIGALMGLSSVLLVNGYGQTRIAFAMSRDGLLPAAFSRLHSRFHTPVFGTVLLGVMFAVVAALLPLSLLSDLISIGVGLAFSIVAISLMWLRSTRPDLPRAFRVPFGGMRIGKIWVGVVPIMAVVLCWAMILPVAIDIFGQAGRGRLAPALILGGYAVVGAIIYLTYGLRASRDFIAEPLAEREP
jgi:APA family basic amino acid/polyamine antiporter